MPRSTHLPPLIGYNVGMGSQKPAIEEIERALFGRGQSPGDYYFIVDDELVVFWPKQEPAITFCFFEGELSTACEEYLRLHGVRECRTLEEVESLRASFSN